MAINFSRSDWWVTAPLSLSGQRIVADAQDKLSSRGRPSAAGDMVSELSFGFWVSLVSGTYHRTLWERDLHDDLQTMLLFRNRIMHHEPIHHRHLEADHQTILRVLGYISPDMVRRLKPYDPVPVVLGRRPDRRP